MWRTPRCYSASAAPHLEPSVVFVGERIQSRVTVYATGIPNYLRDSEKVAEIFSRAGKIRRDFRGQMRIKMYNNKRDGSFNGRARITYETDKEAFLACHLLDQARHGENVLKVKMALDHFRNQRNEPNLEKSDWTCNLCDKRGLTRVNYVWQTTCYNCQNDKTFGDSFGKTANECSLRNKPEMDVSRSPQPIVKPPTKKNLINNKKANKLKEKSNQPVQLKVEMKEEVDREEILRHEVTTDSGVHSSSVDDSSESSSESSEAQHLNVETKKPFEKKVQKLEGAPQPVESDMVDVNVMLNVHNISSSETDSSMDTHEADDQTLMKTEKEEEVNASLEYFEHSDNILDKECDNLDINRLKNELESEIEVSLLNTFKKYEIFNINFPLHIKINVSSAVKNVGLERLSLNNEKLNVDLSLDESMTKAVIQKGQMKRERRKFQMQRTALENVTDNEDQGMNDTQAKPSKLTQTSGNKETGNESTSSEESDDDNFDKPGSVFISMNSFAAQASKDTNHDEDEKSRRKFTLDQDKVILDKIIDILPGHRLDYLELVPASSPCKEVANKLSRTESSIQGRWKYSLRTWLLEYFKKKTKSWTGFTVKASVERRKAVAHYFVREIRKRGININRLTATVK